MVKKKDRKTGKKSKTPLRATAAEYKAQSVEKNDANEAVEETRAEAPKTVEVIVEDLPAEITETVQKDRLVVVQEAAVH